MLCNGGRESEAGAKPRAMIVASKRRLRRRACERKVRYVDEWDASSALDALVRSGAKGGASTVDLHSYHCQFCGGFHLGHDGALMSQNRQRTGRRGL